MNKYKALALIIALILPAAFISCNSLLDEQPDDRITVNSPELVRRLLINAYPSATPTLVSPSEVLTSFIESTSSMLVT